MEYNFTIENLSKAVAEFKKAMGDNRLFAFEGEMGAGKTTFIAELCRQIGAQDEFGSPTFSIINEYNAEGKKIYHFDFYRLNRPEEALDIGIEDYFYSGALCFMEWPDKIDYLLPEETVKVSIIVKEDGSRTIRICE